MIGASNAMVTAGVLKQQRDNLLTAIEAGLAEKNRTYVPGASEIARFYLGQHKYLFSGTPVQTNQLSLFIKTDSMGGKSETRTPIFQMTDNVAANYLQIFSPYLLQGIIERTVEAQKPFNPPPSTYGIDPQQLAIMKLQTLQNHPQGQQIAMQYAQQQQMANMQMAFDQANNLIDLDLRKARAEMMETVLNYSATELNHAAERKRVVEESLILGCGVYLTQIVQLPMSGQKLIGSQYVMMEDIIWDPDCTRWKDAKWLAIRCRAPAWLLSRISGAPEADLKPLVSSAMADQYRNALVITAGNNIPRSVGNDEVVYYKFYSRMGAGCRLKTMDQRSKELLTLDEILGDYCFFMVSESCEYPLNMNPAVFDAIAQLEMQAQQQQMMGQGMLMAMGQQMVDPWMPLKQACAWQIPFHLDQDDPWPVTTVEHYLRNGSPYPIPPLEFALAYMKFMVWVISFIADKAYRSNRTFWAIDETNSEELKKVIQDCDDEAILTLKNLGDGTIDKFIKMIDAPEIKATIFDVYNFMNQRFEQSTGMNELNQAQMSRTMRSATEADILDEASKLRPQAMSKNVLDADSRVARKEAIANQLLLTAQDVMPILGQPGAKAWDKVMKSIDPVQLVRETQYDVVAAQGRVHDLNQRQHQSDKMVQLVLPMLTQIAMTTGQFSSVKVIVDEWAKANQIDPDLIQFPDMPPEMMMPGVKGQGSQPKEKSPQQGPK